MMFCSNTMETHSNVIERTLYMHIHVMCMSPSLEQNNDYHSLNIYYMMHLGALTYVLSFGLTLTKRQISTQISIFLSST